MISEQQTGNFPVKYKKMFNISGQKKENAK